ncbi:hypothetical protein M2147_002960, partial [Ohessyouella blattaphilus]
MTAKKTLLKPVYKDLGEFYSLVSVKREII